VFNREKTVRLPKNGILDGNNMSSPPSGVVAVDVAFVYHGFPMAVISGSISLGIIK